MPLSLSLSLLPPLSDIHTSSHNLPLACTLALTNRFFTGEVRPGWCMHCLGLQGPCKKVLFNFITCARFINENARRCPRGYESCTLRPPVQIAYGSTNRMVFYTQHRYAEIMPRLRGGKAQLHFEAACRSLRCHQPFEAMGLHLNPRTGAISGTAANTAIGAMNVTVVVSNNGGTASVTLELHVSPPPPTPAPSPLPPLSELCRCNGWDIDGRGGTCKQWGADKRPWCYVSHRCPYARKAKSDQHDGKDFHWRHCDTAGTASPSYAKAKMEQMKRTANKALDTVVAFPQCTGCAGIKGPCRSDHTKTKCAALVKGTSLTGMHCTKGYSRCIVTPPKGLRYQHGVVMYTSGKPIKVSWHQHSNTIDQDLCNY
jgi:hypothetical protein